ncbi:metal-dependent hydrolase [Aciduricibacillus chroicocephali]|uniref:Metal-dependent hydrolase n=1 Tax=Aciduricibacillus chroicocephali TaxID=3054939 RepID=A0ABY9KYF9_9BACI|nr:metal-dependent hydrolase [Bacillaceae bacterium 44XB]
MDTGTHIVMGVALGGLSTLDPVVANDPTLFHAIFAGAIIGSHAPDFDTVLKLRNNATYIRNHRGPTHSIPAVIMWGLLISGAIYLFVPEVSYLHLWSWIALAVALHVFVDIFNAYGTQALKPFSNRWIALGFINTFDPYIFLLHIVGIVAWILGAPPGKAWLVVYAVIFLYYIKRYLDKREIVRKIKEFLPDTERVATSPTTKQNSWRVAITGKDEFHVGTVDNGHIQIIDEFERTPLPDTEIMNVALKDKNISAFLSFSPVYRHEITDFDDFTEVRLIDLRYRTKGYYPFVAVVHLDDNLNILTSYTGWIFSEHKLQNKLNTGNSIL